MNVEKILNAVSTKLTVKYLIGFFLSVVCIGSFAQPALKWGVGTQGGVLDEYVQTVATDPSGNVYVAGSFEGTVDFDYGSGVSNLTSAGGFDAFMAKYNSLGGLIWVKRMGGSAGDDEIYAITTDASGNVYVTGYFQGTVDFDPDAGAVNITSNGAWDAFFGKYSTLGAYTWANKIGSATGDDFGTMITVDASLNVYVGGIFTGTTDFDPSAAVNNRTAVGLEDGFFGKYTSAGLYVWANGMGSTGNDACRGLSLVGSNIWYGGYYGGTMNVDPAGTLQNATNLGGLDGFFGQYNQSDGKLSGNWGTIRGTSDDVITSIIVVGTSLYTAGYFSGSAAMFGNNATGVTKNSAGGTDLFVAKHDASTVNLTWMDAMGGANNDGVNLMALDGSGNVFITGYFAGSFDFDPTASVTMVSSGGGTDIFGARLLPATGGLNGVGTTGSIGDDQGTSVAIDASSNIYLAEIFENNVNLDYRGGIYNIAAAGSVDWALVRYDQTVFGADPSAQPTSFTTSAITSTTGTVSWSAAAGAPSGYIVTRAVSTAPTNTPIDGNTYTASQTWQDFTVAYVGSSTSFGEIGLTAGTTYQYKIYSYTGSAASINYLTSSPLTGSLTTSPAFLPPTISSFGPVSGAVGATVTIIGTNFSATPASNIVFFGATKASVQTATSTQLTVQVPSGASYSPITVKSPGGTAYSKVPFMPTFPGSGVVAASSFAANFSMTGGGTETNHTVIQDIDLDGKPDLLLTANANLSIYRNISSPGALSSASFASKVDFAFTNSASNHLMSVGDLDNDGKPDIMIAGNNVASIFRNNSTSGTINTGSLTKTDLPVADVRSGTIFDFDGDGVADIALGEYVASTIKVYRNQNTAGAITVANLGSPIVLTASTSPTCVAAGDIDGDGKPDLIVGNQGTSTMSVFRNTSSIGSISFAARVDFSAPGIPMGLAIGDLDADNKLDVVTANAGGGVSFFRNTAISGSITSGSFAARADLVGGSNTLGVSISDIDGDGKPEIVAASQGLAAVSVFKNNGSGTFATKVDFNAGTNPGSSAAVGDFDGDQRPDVAVGNNTPNQVNVLRNTTTIILPPPTITSMTPSFGVIGSSVTLTGTNFSGTSSIVYFGATKATITSGTSTQLIVTVPNGTTYVPISVTNLGALTAYSPRAFNVTITGAAAISATSFAAKIDAGTGAFPDGLATGDFDLDGKADVVVANGNSASLSTFRNTSSIGSPQFSVGPDLTSGTSPLGPVVVDWDGDGKLDIVAPNPTSTTISIYRNTSPGAGTISFAAKIDLASTSPRVVAVGDMDGDGKPDMAVSNISNANVTVFRNTSTPGSTSAVLYTTFPTGTDPYGVALADVVGDALPDLIVANMTSNTFSVLRNISTPGSISFVAKVDFITASQPQMFAMADYDQDGKLDVAVSCPLSGVISLFRNTTTTTIPTFATRIDLLAASNATGMAADDIDGDGKTDIAAQNVNTNNISVFKNNSTAGTIAFATKFDFATGTTPHYVMSITDIDGDGKKDMLVTNSAANTFSLLRNNVVVTTPEPTDQPTGFIASNQTTSAITVSFTAAASNPNGYIVLRGAAVVPGTDPVDNTAYTVGQAYGNAVVAAIGSATSFNDTGLIAGATYNYKVYSYNGSGSNINYRVTTPLQGSASTAANLATEPTAQPTNFQTSNPTNSSVTVSFTPAAGTGGFIVIRGAAGGAAPTFVPVDGTPQTTGDPVGTGNIVAYSGTASTFNDTGLAASTTYSYRVYSYNGSGASINYLTTSPLSGTGATNNTAPVVPGAFGTITTSNTLDLYTVRFLNSSIAFAGGDNGRLLKTADGGSNWSTVSVPTTSAIWGIYFTSSTNGIAVGSDGLIMKTIDGGTTWTLVSNPATDALYAVQIIPGSLIGYAAGDDGYVLKTTDGGTTWTQLVNAPVQSGSYYNTVYFKTATDGLIAGPNGVVRTTDGGATWTTFSSDPILWYTFPTASVGFGVGSNGKIIKSTDGGTTWTTQTSGVTSTLWNAHFVDVNNGFAVGNDGVILKTTNGGTAWTAALEGTDEVVYSIHFGSGTNGIAVGAAGYIAKAENDPAALSITVQPKSSINYGGTETVAITIPAVDIPRVLNVNLVVIGIVDDAEGGSPIITSLTQTAGLYSGTITSKTDATGDKIGFKYRFEVEYDARFASFQSTTDAYMYVKYKDANTLKLTNLTLAPVGSEDANNYQLISFPITPDDASVTTIFGPANKKEWRLFSSVPSGTSNTTYTELSNGNVALGKGYWLITTKTKTVDLGAGTAYNAKASDPFKLSLAAGYNLIGNPYNFNVGWTAGPAVRELRTFFNGSWSSSTTLEAFKGYFVDADTPGSYPVPLTGNFNGGRMREMRIEQDEKSWELNLVIEQNGLRNEMGRIGMHPEASLGYDVLDDRVFTLPEFFKLASLTIIREEAGRELEQDYVPTTENQVWDFSLKGRDESTPVTLSWKPESIAAIGRDLYLFDEEAISLIDMRTIGTYQTRTNTPLKIITGNPMFVKSQVTFGESRIGNLYPNPTTQGFFVPVAMPKAGEVQVRIFDMKGTEILTQVHFAEEGMQQLGISGLPEGLNGLYLVTTETAGAGRKVQKIIFK